MEDTLKILREHLWLLQYIPPEDIGKALMMILDDDVEVEDQTANTLLAWQVLLRFIEKLELEEEDGEG